MTEKVTYYEIVGAGRSTEEPSGLARRRQIAAGRVDESLRKDLTWGSTTAVIDWEYGNHPGELVEVSEDEAERLIERFRAKWGAGE